MADVLWVLREYPQHTLDDVLDMPLDQVTFLKFEGRPVGMGGPEVRSMDEFRSVLWRSNPKLARKLKEEGAI